MIVAVGGGGCSQPKCNIGHVEITHYITYPHIRTTGHIRMSHVTNSEHPWSRAPLSWQKGRPESRVCWRVRNAKIPRVHPARRK